jgi:hypothetical protein
LDSQSIGAENYHQRYQVIDVRRTTKKDFLKECVFVLVTSTIAALLNDVPSNEFKYTLSNVGDSTAGETLHYKATHRVETDDFTRQ